MSLDTHRAKARLFCSRKLNWMVWLLAPLSWMLWSGAISVSVGHAQTTPPTTLVSDTVFRADGTAAQGVLLISWGPFATAAGAPVAAGNLSTTLGPGGALNVSLVANAGGAPATAYYNIVYQLDDGTVRTEYWMVPTTSPANLAAVRATPGSGVTSQLASQQYVNAAVATKASDTAVVHLSGAETIVGTKEFTVPPSVPAPAGSGDAANKAYVDASVAAVGTGNYVSKSGDTMTGPLNLPADPLSALQATDKHYVDMSVASKASRYENC